MEFDIDLQRLHYPTVKARDHVHPAKEKAREGTSGVVYAEGLAFVASQRARLVIPAFLAQRKAVTPLGPLEYPTTRSESLMANALLPVSPESVPRSCSPPAQSQRNA
jgi:hypothetical protein